MWSFARQARPWLLAAALLQGMAFSAVAQDTFADSGGQFSIDIPSAYVLASPPGGPVYQFKAGLYAKEPGPQIVMLFQPGDTDLNAAYAKALELMGSSLQHSKPEQPIQDLTLNGNAARMGLYSGDVTAQGSGQHVQLFALIGSSVLKRGSAVYLTFMNSGQRAAWEDDLRDVFLSLRNVGDPVAGARDVRPHKP